MQVKICGITRVEDALGAVDAGADALGLVFYKASPRYIGFQTAAAIAAAVPPFVILTGLFVDAAQSEVDQALECVPLNLLQFHGEEGARYCEQFRRPYIKALRMREGLDVSAAMAQHPRARGFLLDAYCPSVPGGTGATFDWDRVPQNSGCPIVLAGGLKAENVAAAIAAARPQGVDVSGGVEQSPGLKDPRKVSAFIRAAKGH
ncbi:phosphoribosylanthranilate isomerase [Microbulbifer spongiae]|uniref:N-(5'-phosphoribosyl)anthranilate isomerase n=1 Tax=Microbulbifer spongiae TaxID=2944933 RepID=A0ABY9ECU7_9GAMM|nr:phosphoribosylanthranilate isomerase [Microbulbifer sp. MI-G]WKD50805.1 phosphoribosylanthranilate isomerase [Microbulbifer sp. MI-G]